MNKKNRFEGNLYMSSTGIKNLTRVTFTYVVLKGTEPKIDPNFVFLIPI